MTNARLTIVAGLLFGFSAQPALAAFFDVGTSSLVVTNGRVGIATSTPQTTLDVNGSAQFGSGATRSTFTATGLLKLTSSGIQWADGTTSTTAASGGGGVATSSATYGDTTVYLGNTASSYGPCLAGSSVTFTGTGAILGLDGVFYKVTSGLAFGRWLVDGATTWNGANVHSIYMLNDTVHQVHWHMPVTGLSAGSHTACLQYYNDGGGTFRPYVGNNQFPTYWALGVP